MKLYCPITIDLYRVYPLQVMEAQQGNVGRGAIVTLTAGSAVIDPTDETVEVYAKKPDGTVSWLECSVEDAKVKINFTNQMLMSPGMLQVELRMKDDEDDITTPIFNVKVNKSNVQSAGRSENELPLLDQIKKNAEDAKTAAEAAETAVGNKVTNPAIGAVGQILEIETVDDEGKPLTYKAVEKPESGVDKELSQIIHASKYGIVSDGFSDTVIVIGKDAAAGDVIKYVIEENSGDITVIYDNNDTGEFNITTIDHAGEAAGEKTLTAEKYCTYTFPSEMDVYLPFNIPAKTSQLTDDVGFAKQEEVGKLSEEIDAFKNESGTAYIEQELTITNATSYNVETGMVEANVNGGFTTNKISVYPSQKAIVTLYSGQYFASIAMFDKDGLYKGRLYDKGVNFYYWENKEVVIPNDVYYIAFSGIKSADKETKLALEKNFQNIVKETVNIVEPQIESNTKDILSLNEYIGVNNAVDTEYSFFDGANTSTFEEIEKNHVKITVNSTVENFVVGLKCTPSQNSIEENNDKKLFVSVDCDYEGEIVCFLYGNDGYIHSIPVVNGEVVIDLANLEVYYSRLNYLVVGVLNPSVGEIELSVSLSLDQLKTNEYYGGDMVSTINNIGNKLASSVAENEAKKCGYLYSPNGTLFKLRVDNDGNVTAKSTINTVESALFCGNSLLVSNGGSGMCASSPEKDYFSLVCSFLKSRNDAFVYHVWNDEIDGTETAIKADNFAGVFENLTTVEGVQNFLPTLDKYFADYIPDYISIQLGDNSAQNVDFFTGQALPLLFDYLQSKAPNALIVCMGAWYTTKGLLSGIAKTCANYDIIFVDFSGCKRTETCNEVGATVIYPDRSEHTITSAGVASHPNDKGFEEIANLVITAIDPYVKSVT